MVFIWNLNPSGSVYKYIGHKDAITDVKFSPTGAQIASASKDETVKLWSNTAEGNSVTIKAHNAPVRSVNYSYDGQLLLTGSDDKTLHVYKV
jgi:centriolar protein POC1